MKIDVKILNLKRKSDICAILIAYNRLDYTKKQIKLLTQQSIKPDILIIDNSKNCYISKYLKKEFKDISLLCIKKENIGTAGCFFVGEKIAYDIGYKYFLISDDDAFPLNKKYIEHALKEFKKDKNIGIVVSTRENFKNSFEIAQLGIIKREVFDKCGFTYAQFFRFCEDIEFILRVSKYFKIKKIKDIHKHPYGAFAGETPNNLYYSIRNSLLLYCVYLHNTLKNPFVLFIRITDVLWHLLEGRKKFIYASLLAYKDFLIKNFKNKPQIRNEVFNVLNEINNDFVVLLPRKSDKKMLPKKIKIKNIEIYGERGILKSNIKKETSFFKQAKILMKNFNKNILTVEYFPPILLYLYKSVQTFHPKVNKIFIITKQRNEIVRIFYFLLLFFGSFILLFIFLIILFIYHFLVYNDNFFIENSKNIKLSII
ncbi:MAG: hypothetical protein QXF15_02400 [Candidatus Aenigmatarchaeota archaeon]